MDTKKELEESLDALVNYLDKLLPMIVEQESPIKFNIAYQKWYTRALELVRRLAPDRLEEFISYYQIDPKRKYFTFATYRIADYVQGLGASKDLDKHPKWDIYAAVRLLVSNQMAILSSLKSRIHGVLADVEGALLADLQDTELEAANKLKKINLRAAGTVAGVVLEGHLRHLVEHNQLKTKKKNPTLGDLNDLLKEGKIYDTSKWRKIQLLADHRNHCAHKKDREPTLDDVNELIEGTNWAIKTL